MSDFSNADVDAAAAKLRGQGIDPARVTLACALDIHEDCPGIVDAPAGAGTVPCRCRACAAKHVATHQHL